MSSSSTDTTAAHIRVAIAGAGLMGRWHAHAAVRADARVVAVVDPDAARAERLCAGFRGARAAGRLGDVLADVDVVHVCTPAATHTALVTEALEAGRHTLVEKPLASTEQEVAALLDLADRRGVLLCPVHQFPFQPGVREALARLPVIAPVRHVMYRTCSAGAIDRDALDVAIEILPHPFSLLARLVPEIEGIEWSVRQPVGGEIHALAQAGDMTASILISMSGRPTTNMLELIGAGGTISVDLFHGFSVTHGGQVSRLRKVAQPFAIAGRTARVAAVSLVGRAWRREPAYPGLRQLLQSFYDAVRDGGPCPIPPAESLAITRASQRLERQLRAYDVR